MALADDMKRLARDAFNDISTTYQAVLTQNTGWTNTSLFHRAEEQEISAEAARKQIEQPAQPTHEAPELNPGQD
jgi:hypothetical protein